MKKYIKIILVIWLAYACFSCDKFLETESNSTFTEKSVFTNLDFATKAVNSIYNNLTSMNLYEYYIGLYYKCDNDIECSIYEDDGSKRSLSHYAGNEGSTTLQGTWEDLYSSIERANICIDNLPQSPIWEGEYAGEAHRLYGEFAYINTI